MISLGIDRLKSEASWQKQLQGRRVALLGHAASTDRELRSTLDILGSLKGVHLVCAFGPQHGVRGEKQDNMEESDDFVDPIWKIPVYSLYGTSRTPNVEMVESFDLLLIDLQDVGCRIYTYTTTMLYMLQACAEKGREVWVLDRPNPAGRVIEGTLLEPGWESFVGLGPIPIRHGLTFGELARWMVVHYQLDVKLEVLSMEGYDPHKGPGYGWPVGELSWVNPSPNAASISMARCYAGTILLEGTELSEGRGTTRPLELVGAPWIDPWQLLKSMYEFAPEWMQGCRLRVNFFQPTFQKHVNQLCGGFQIHVDDVGFDPNTFRPYRMFAALFKVVRRLYPQEKLWRSFHYEYEKERLAIDLINGGPFLREWVEESSSTKEDFEKRVVHDEAVWSEIRRPFLIYDQRGGQRDDQRE